MRALPRFYKFCEREVKEQGKNKREKYKLISTKNYKIINQENQRIIDSLLLNKGIIKNSGLFKKL